MEYKRAKLEKYLECAKVINTHGVKGVLKLESRTDDPTVLAKLSVVYEKKDEKYVPLKIISASVQKGNVLAAVEGVDSVEKAIEYKNRILYADRNDLKLKPGEHFIADIIGLDVYDTENRNTLIGTLSDVLCPAGQQVYVVKKENGKTFMIPCVPSFIKKVSLGEDCDAGIYVKLIEGMDDTGEN